MAFAKNMKPLLYITAILTFSSMTNAEEPNKTLHPKYPVIEGKYKMTKEWSLTLDQKFNRRFEDDGLVIWRSGFTIWVSIWGLEKGKTPLQQLEILKGQVNKKATDLKISKEKLPYTISYRLKEEADDKREAALYGFSVGVDGYVQSAIYFNKADDLKKAAGILESVSYTKSP